MIPQYFIQDLLTRVDILEIIGSRIQLKKSGANFWACCPFHSEKTPSFSVNPAKQFFHCFGCGRTGSAISFLMEYSGLTFPEAIEDLAQSIGLTVPHEGSLISGQNRESKRQRTLALTEIMELASQFYRKELRKSELAIHYLKERGLTGEIAAKFGLGYAPDSWTPLHYCFEQYMAKELVDAGLVIDKSKDNGSTQNGRYDRFRRRIMFPIRNERGQVIAFGGRVLNDEEPKYLNSPETSLFSKGSELYGLFEARLAIREAQYALVVEGYMDVVALSQLGFSQVVATLGTACTEMHVRKLFRYTDKIIFSFDGDNAGRHAAKRAMESSLGLVNDEKQVAFLFLPSDHDPDSFIRSKGTEAFAEQVKHAEPLSEFLLAEILDEADLETMEGCAKVLNRAKPWCSAMRPSALRLQIIHKLVELTHMPIDDVLGILRISHQQTKDSGSWKSYKRYAQEKISEKGYRQASLKVRRSAMPSLDRQALRILVRYPILMQSLTEKDMTIITTGATDNGKLFEQIKQQIILLGTGNTDVQHAALIEALRQAGINVEPLVKEIVDDELSEKMANVQLQGIIRQMQIKQITVELNELVKKTGLQKTEDQESYRRLQNELALLQQAAKADNEQNWLAQDENE